MIEIKTIIDEKFGFTCLACEKQVGVIVKISEKGDSCIENQYWICPTCLTPKPKK